MQNPSVASAVRADKSVQFLERIVFEKGDRRFADVKTLVILNQFAFIQTNDFDGDDSKIGPKNDLTIESCVKESQIVIVAWGKANPYIERQKTILEILKKHPGKTLYQGRSHPSRASYKGYVIPFGNGRKIE